MLQTSSQCSITPKLKKYTSVQIDEMWSYVGKKKEKRWIIYAYAPETGEVLGYGIGKRGTKTVRKLYKMLKNIEIEEYCTDEWKAFKQVFREENHKISKANTKHIEGMHTKFRARNRRLVRRTTCFSKKDIYHEAAIKMMFFFHNYFHHTF